MKTRFIIPILLLAFCAFGTSCRLHLQRIADDTLAEVKPYFPYSLDETIVFVNEQLADSIEFVVSQIKERAYGDNNISSKNYGCWDATMTVNMVLTYPQTKYEQRSHISFSAFGDETVGLMWASTMLLKWEKVDEAHVHYRCKEEEITNYMTDTIMVPVIENPTIADKRFDPYMRVVKNYGLTDFSLDGKTTYRRIKQ